MGKSQADLNKHGSGLGLNICRKIVEKMGGEISLDSVIGKGTTAKFTIKAQCKILVDCSDPLI